MYKPRLGCLFAGDEQGRSYFLILERNHTSWKIITFKGEDISQASSVIHIACIHWMATMSKMLVGLFLGGQMLRFM